MKYVRVDEIVEYEGAQYECVRDVIPDVDCAEICAFNGRPACMLYECLRSHRPDKTNIHFVKVEGRV